MNTRVLVIVICITLIVTFCSLSELHSLSALHVAEDVSDRLSSGAPQGIKGDSSSVVRLGGQKGPASVLATPTQQPAVSDTLLPTVSRRCYVYQETELWGDVVGWGTNNKVDSIEQCCQACRDHKPAGEDDPDCNVFVWCGDEVQCKHQFRECWLKHLAHPAASKPAKQGRGVPWTSGTLDVDINADPGLSKRTGKVDHEARRFHVVTSAQGAAVHWQARIHYYWYKKQKAACEAAGGCEMGGFTRLLHSGQPDDLVDEIPTVVVDPLPQHMVEHSWYIVLNRPYAFVQWVKSANIPERYVLMSEPDHIFLRPLPNFMDGETPAAFPFFYIEPSKKDFRGFIHRFTGPASRRQLEEIAPIGSSPTFMAWDDLARTMPLWMNVSIAIFKDPEANKAWGWVQEMYGFTIAAWLAGVKRFDLYLHMMAQPPWDMEMSMAQNKPFYILHYTYGMDYKLTGEFTPGKVGEWRFDKRWYGGRPIPRHLGPPPVGMKNDLVRALIDSFNEATEAIPCWDQYVPTGKVPKLCDEQPKHFLAVEAAAKARLAGRP